MDGFDVTATRKSGSFPTCPELRAERLARIGNLLTTDISEWEPAVDIAQCPKTSEGYYLLPRFVRSVDYCDSALPPETRWVTHIGRDREGRLLADIYGKLQRDRSIVELLWVR